MRFGLQRRFSLVQLAFELGYAAARQGIITAMTPYDIDGPDKNGKRGKKSKGNEIVLREIEGKAGFQLLKDRPNTLSGSGMRQRQHHSSP